NGRTPWLYLVGLTIYVVNQKVSRFADIQSMYMMMAGLTVAVIMTSADHCILLPGWLALSPLFTDIYRGNINKSILEIPPVLAPFPIRPLLEAMDRFLAPVPDGRRVLLAFADPQEAYYRVFDGYRVLIELPIYVASRRRIHIFPDLWAVLEANYPGAPDFWGRDPEAVKANLDKWAADYVIVYSGPGREGEPDWVANGFRELAGFSWKEHTASWAAMPSWLWISSRMATVQGSAPNDPTRKGLFLKSTPIRWARSAMVKA
ncbi:MAG: hypothetical protein HQK58_17865, partial [Deltaproteobacteria bacterium]|nr:hypothetical protein [Deltaproteobacteria bacterium]